MQARPIPLRQKDETARKPENQDTNEDYDYSLPSGTKSLGLAGGKSIRSQVSMVIFS